MQMRAVVTLVSGIILAGVAVYMVNQQLGKKSDEMAEPKPAFDVATIVVATEDLPFGNRIGPGQLNVVSWPKDAVPEGSFTSIDALLGDGTEERVVLKSIIKNEPVLATKVSGFGGRASMSAVLPKGKRAFSIRVNDVSGVGGFLLPGDRVDILLTRQVTESEDPVTDIILQNITVRGIDQTADEEQDQPQVIRTATVEVSPEESQKLALAMKVGTLSLALRDTTTTEQSSARTINVADLVGKIVQPEATDSPPVLPHVRVRRGMEATMEKIAGE